MVSDLHDWLLGLICRRFIVWGVHVSYMMAMDAPVDSISSTAKELQQLTARSHIASLFRLASSVQNPGVWRVPLSFMRDPVMWCGAPR